MMQFQTLKKSLLYQNFSIKFSILCDVKSRYLAQFDPQSLLCTFRKKLFIRDAFTHTIYGRSYSTSKINYTSHADVVKDSCLRNINTRNITTYKNNDNNSVSSINSHDNKSTFLNPKPNRVFSKESFCTSATANSENLSTLPHNFNLLDKKIIHLYTKSYYSTSTNNNSEDLLGSSSNNNNSSSRHSSSSTKSTPSATSPELLLSESCIKQLRELTSCKGSEGSKKEFLRILVEGGGCSGFQYKFELDDKRQTDDRAFGPPDAEVVVDEVSLSFLKGSTIDFHTELIRAAFRILDNPQSEAGCSCGASFSIKV